MKPALGRTWTYVPSTRVMLSQQQRPTDVRTATITKSSRQVWLQHVSDVWVSGEAGKGRESVCV